MEEKVLEKNTQLLHLFEKMKYMATLASKFYRKDMHYGFNIWREECRAAKKVSNVLETAFCKVLPNHLKRHYFGQWLKTSSVLKRIEIAGMLLEDFE